MQGTALLITLLQLCIIELGRAQPCASPRSLWDYQRDDLAEYWFDRTDRVASIADCVSRAKPQHQAVAFGQLDGVCRMLSCRRGWSGCRKCRNAVNSSLPLLMVRRLERPGCSCWRTFQHRVDGSVNFYRNWTSYLSPFGQGEDRNYWMGLNAINSLTQAGDRRVRWEMSLWNDTWYWWENVRFVVQGNAQGYRVTVGDQDIIRSSAEIRILQQEAGGPYFMNNSMFSTYDRDQDTKGDGGSCAFTFRGAWWFSGCHKFDPNGQYFTPPNAINLAESDTAAGITVDASNVYPFNHRYSMQSFECLVTDYL